MVLNVVVPLALNVVMPLAVNVVFTLPLDAVLTLAQGRDRSLEQVDVRMMRVENMGVRRSS